ncbi:MAG: PepSY-associated TM helix domain-containing protein [Duganella sp.]
MAARWSLRTVLLPVHRYVGLLLALFLALAGLTGSLLAWNEELEAVISPQLFRVAAPAPGAARIDPLQLHEQVRARYPAAFVARVPLEQTAGRSVMFALRALPGKGAGKGGPLANDQVFVDPYTGQTLGERRWGDISQGSKNLMPFIYRLHYSLALDGIGTLIFGVVSLLWTLDCFVGAWLTFPRRREHHDGGRHGAAPIWLARWWPSWQLRSGSVYKISFNLHRAGGLWTWALLLVLAWSSVAFNLPQVYEPAMKTLFSHQRGMDSIARLKKPRMAPAIGWEPALLLARQQMAAEARTRGFVVEAEKSLLYDPVRGVYRYDVRSSSDIRHRGGHTRMVIDGDSGVVRGLWLPTGAASGDTVTTWLTTLHMAALGGWPVQLLMSVMGLAVLMLSVTGVVVWWKKRAGRGKQGARMVQRGEPAGSV